MDVYYALGEAGLRAALELVHCVLDKPQWDDDALERAKEVYHTSAKTVGGNSYVHFAYFALWHP